MAAIARVPTVFPQKPTVETVTNTRKQEGRNGLKLATGCKHKLSAVNNQGNDS